MKRITLSTLVASFFLLAAVPCFGLRLLHTRRSAHASVRHSSLHSRSARFSMRRATAERREAALHHEAIVHRDAIPLMAPDRATQIQSALIKAGYLTGEPTGIWDASSIAAMQKLQADNGWQTKLTPDARALIKLGLGPQQGDSQQADSQPSDSQLGNSPQAN